MFVSVLLQNSVIPLLINYSENIFLILFFLVSYYAVGKYMGNDTLSNQEKLTRQKLAEEYLNKHREEDDEFFYGALSTSGSASTVNTN